MAMAKSVWEDNESRYFPYGHKHQMEALGCGEDIVYFTDYNGTQSVTSTGKTCLPWHMAHDKAWKPSKYKQLTGNYCRNPSKNPRGAWCYVRNGDSDDIDFEFCALPCWSIFQVYQYMQKGCGNNFIYQYTGTKSVTRSGKKCMNWDAATRKYWYKYLAKYPELKENYCRNPSKDKNGPWCYTSNTKKEGGWETCDIPECPTKQRMLSKLGCGSDKKAKDYTGKVSQTWTGVQCVPWAKGPNVKYRHLKSNYCRNPSNAKTAWCYTSYTDKKQWAHCHIPC
jgi:hypothetical protein